MCVPGAVQGSSEAGRLRFVPSFRLIAMTTPLISQAGTEQGPRPVWDQYTQIHTYQMSTVTPAKQYIHKVSQNFKQKNGKWTLWKINKLTTVHND